MSFSCRTQPPVMTGGGVPKRKRHYGPGIEVGCLVSSNSRGDGGQLPSVSGQINPEE